MSKKKKEKKSLSVNDIPVTKNSTQLLKDLDMDDYRQLLGRCAQSSYNRKSDGFLNTPINDDNGVINVLVKTLRDEDAENERKKREERKNYHEEVDLRRPPSVSPTLAPLPRRPGIGCRSFAADDFDYIDSGNDVEMQDLTHVIEKKPIQYSRGNEEKICDEYWDNDFQKELSDIEKQPITTRHTLFERLSMDNNDLQLYNSSCPPNRLTGRLGGMSVTSETNTDDTNSTGGDVMPLINTIHYSMTPGFEPFPPFDSRFNHQIQDKRDSEDNRPQVNSVVAEKKRRKQQRKLKQEKYCNSYKVPDRSYMGDTPAELDDLVKYITDSTESKKTKDALKDRRRNSKENKKETTATIGNHQAKAQAAAPSSKPQSSNGPTMTKDKKSPNKKNKKGNTANNNNNINNNAARCATGRLSTEEAEEEFLSADEGIVSSNSDDVAVVNAPTSDVMMDGGNYLADSDDLPCLDNHNTEEQEFITVSSRDKKKRGNPSQAQRTGSTGKVERRGNQRFEQQRRNSMEERPKGRPRPQVAAALGDYWDEKKPETHTKAKFGPFKEHKKKHDRLESTADSEYMDAQDEMVSTSPVVNGTSTPERVFSYADAAKKSAEPSRENSPACVNQVPGTPTPVTPSPSPPAVETTNPGPGTSTTTTTDEAPVSLPTDDNKVDNTADLSFFYDEGAHVNTQKDDNGTNGDFVLNLNNGKVVKFAVGMAAPSYMQPVDEHHQAMVNLMKNRWQLFTSQGPAPVYYSPKSSLQV